MKPFDPGVYFVRRFLITDFTFKIDSGLLKNIYIFLFVLAFENLSISSELSVVAKSCSELSY